MVPGMEIFFRRLGEAFLSSGAFRLNFIEVNGELAAGTIGFRWGDQSYLYNSAFDRAWGSLAPGMVLVGEDIRLAIEDGARAFDLLKGDYDYKYRFGADAAAPCGGWSSDEAPRDRRGSFAGRDRRARRRRRSRAHPTRAAPPDRRRRPATSAIWGARPTMMVSGFASGGGTSPAPRPQCHVPAPAPVTSTFTDRPVTSRPAWASAHGSIRTPRSIVRNTGQCSQLRCQPPATPLVARMSSPWRNHSTTRDWMR